MSSAGGNASGTIAQEGAAHATSTADPDVWPVPWRFLGIFLAWNALLWVPVGLALAPVLPGGWAAIAGAFVLVAAPLGAIVRTFTGAPAPGAFTRVLVLRPFWYAQLALPLLAVAAVVGALVGWPLGGAGAGARLALTVVGAAFATVAVTGYAGSRRLVVRDLTVAFPDLPTGLDGFRIAQVSDVHVGPHTPRAFLARITRAVEDARPDLIAFTGDQVDDHPEDVPHFAAAFGALRAPAGVWVIPGNHDVYAGWHAVRRGLEDAGFRVLVNDAAELAHDGARFWVAGTGDPAARHVPGDAAATVAPDVGRTLAEIPEGAFTLALAHNPALWPALADRGVDLTLSGHTHHGQFSIPGLGWCLASPFLEHAMGTPVRGRSVLHINPGTNYWGLPLRLGAWPEVTVVTLQRGGDGAPAVVRDVVRRA